jgi:predicted alpha/beta superfamily hydrolase
MKDPGRDCGSARHTLTGNFRLYPAFQSTHLRRKRDLLVYLPPGYETHPNRRFPVLYLQDGQNLFDGATAYIQDQEWGVDETAERLIRTGAIEPLIIVGIYNAGDHRIDEYTPTLDERHGRGGKADAYAAMLTSELKPFIDSEFRTRRGPENTGLGGSSLGGLLTLAIGLRHSSTFGKLAVMSPSLWWDNEFILRRAREVPEKLPLRIWLDMGSEEGEGYMRQARDLRDMLESKGWTDGLDLQHWEAMGAGHSEAAWAQRMEQVLRFLFPMGSRG